MGWSDGPIVTTATCSFKPLEAVPNSIGILMPTFVHLITLTADGLAHLASGHQPPPAETARRFGGELLADYLTLGRYDIVVVSSFPDDAAATQFALAMAGEGHSRSETLRAFDTDQFADIIQALDPTD